MNDYLLERFEKKLKRKDKKKGIRHFSEKREKKQREYRKLVSEILKEDNRCKVNAPGCLLTASGLHHKQKRTIKNLTDKNNLIPACNNCQTWIEEHPKEAEQKGLSISKFKQL